MYFSHQQPQGAYDWFMNESNHCDTLFQLLGNIEEGGCGGKREGILTIVCGSEIFQRSNAVPLG